MIYLTGRKAGARPINIAFLNQDFLIERETASALRRLRGVRVAAIDIVPHPAPGQIAQLIRVIEREQCSMLVTINEWGMDAGGALAEYLDKKGIVHANWSADDPFFEEIINTGKFRPAGRRFDFVSDKGYVRPMIERGYRAHFLPLAVDPAWFHPDPSENGTNGHDIVFVGNSYREQMDRLLKISPGFVDTLAPFLGEVVRQYHENVEYDVEGHIRQKLKKTRLPEGLPFEKACFIAKHAAGFFGRKQIVVDLAKKYPGFMVFGEKGWLAELQPERLGTAKYYNSLCSVYRKSKIVIDINRMVIRNGFTQRAFDVPASGGFVITSSKPVVHELFATAGPAKEMAVFRSRRELFELIDFYLAREDERKSITERGRKKILERHTYDHRIAEMFRVIQAGL